MAIEEEKKNKRVQFPRRGTAANNAYTGRAGEITIDNERKELRVHLDDKQGGYRIPTLTGMLALFLGIGSEAAKLKFNNGKTGLLARVSDSAYAAVALEANDGLTVLNPKGIDGNPTIGLPERLAAEAGDGVATVDDQDANKLLETGFYSIDASALNLPTDVSGASASTLTVVRRSSTDVTQVLVNLSGEINMWTRSLLAGVWQAWTSLKPQAGTDEILEAGTDGVQRTWTSFQLNQLITDRFKDLGVNDGDDTDDVQNYGAQKRKFKDRFTGRNISPQVYGPYGSVKDMERWIVSYSTRPYVQRIGGSSGTDRYYGGGVTVQLKIGGTYVDIANLAGFNGSPGNRPADLSHGTVRFRYNATSTQIEVLNIEGLITEIHDGTWTGEIKFTSESQTEYLEVIGNRFRIQNP